NPENPFEWYSIEYEKKQYNLNFPLSAGMASSALVCLIKAKGDIQKAYVLEDEFDKKSSGVDIAAWSKATPIIYQNRKSEKLTLGSFDAQGLLLTYLGTRESHLKNHSGEILEKVDKFENDYMKSFQNVLEGMQTGDFSKIKVGFEWNVEIQRSINI